MREKEQPVALPIPVLKTVPGYYEPVLTWEDVKSAVGGRFELKHERKVKQENLKQSISKQLKETLANTWKKSEFDPDKAFFKGNKELFKALRVNPCANIDSYVANGVGGGPSWGVARETKAIQAAYNENIRNIDTICEQLLSMYQGQVNRPPEDHPLHYSTFFISEGDVKAQLVAFFSDYAKPQKSSYNQNAFFLMCKEKSRHYAPLANGLAEALGKLTLRPGSDENELNWELKNMLEGYREELVKQMLSEKRPFESSHLLRRIDYALGVIEQRKGALEAASRGRRPENK